MNIAAFGIKLEIFENSMISDDLEFEFSDEEDDDVSDGTISDIESETDSDEEYSRFELFLI